MRGRKPTPNALKQIRGTIKPSRTNKNQMQPAALLKMPQAPRWFSAIAKKIYKQKSAELIAQGVMSSLDIDMFLLYCHEYAVYIETSAELSKTVLTENLSDKQEAIYKRIQRQNRQAWERSKAIAIEFGFTPSSRSRVTRPEATETDNDDFC